MYFLLFLLFVFAKSSDDDLGKALLNGNFELVTEIISKFDKNSSDYLSLNQTLHLSKNIFTCAARILKNSNESYEMNFVENCSKDVYLLFKYTLLNSTLIKSDGLDIFRFLFRDVDLDKLINENDTKYVFLNVTNKTCAFYDCMINDHTNTSCISEFD